MSASRPGADSRVQALSWCEEGLRLLDQRRLPHTEQYLLARSADAVTDAIRNMTVRGAPAIGIAAAYAVALASREAWRAASAGWRDRIAPELARLRGARPTAVNLGWAVTRMEALFAGIDGDPYPVLRDAALALHAEDATANVTMGAAGARLIDPGAVVLTHCNAGALATGGWGTALGVVRSAWQAGRIARVYAGETRPWLQGARLTAWELLRDGIPVDLVADAAAAHLMRTRGVDWVIVGADRIAANGDVANKIGTYGLAVLARAHATRVMVVAPVSTIDPAVATGADIPIEERAGDELLDCGGRPVAAPGAGAWNPVFDVTPAACVDVLVTERAVLAPVDGAGIARLLERAGR
ncbi:MAG: S-methyl-5-thioribose-1-phosphate isomerase [Gammaproteobacteria bacterium]|nr:S-methyl-5-thioribose-1-phosphate isomerase [Gammaproteobacteria bacterium]